ncbi:MAG: RNA polymerase sigma factor [Flavobacteriaceae bacterium]
MSLQQDQHWIEETIKGNGHAFADLIDRYKHMVFTLAVKILRNREEAEEVAQDVFVKVYQSLNTFKGDSKFSTWLYRIAYHRSLDYLKKQGRQLSTSSIDEFTGPQFPVHENYMDAFDTVDRAAIIKSAIDALHEEDAIVITLHYYEELSLKEISQVMGIGANTVKVRLFRSRKRLEKLLIKLLEPEIIKGYGEG